MAKFTLCSFVIAVTGKDDTYVPSLACSAFVRDVIDINAKVYRVLNDITAKIWVDRPEITEVKKRCRAN